MTSTQGRPRGPWWRMCRCWTSFLSSAIRARRPRRLFTLGLALFLLLGFASLQLRSGEGVLLNTRWFNIKMAHDSQHALHVHTVQAGSNANKTESWEGSGNKDDQENSLDLLPSDMQIAAMEQQLRQMRQMVQPGKFRIVAPSTDSTSASRFGYRQLTATQAQRQMRIRHVCEAKRRQESSKGTLASGETRYHEGWFSRKDFYKLSEVYLPQHFFFCPVLKVGSTFFRRLFFALGHGMSIKSPYEIPILTALGSKTSSLSSIGNRPVPGNPLSSTMEQAAHDFLDKAGKVMFTREPYSKLLSGYVDKLWAPNPYFWGAVGSHAIKAFRKPQQSDVRCAHDLTFTEYIKYVIVNEQTNKLSRDRHFVPSYDQCKPCTYQFDIIGKMETFAADTSLVLTQLGHNLSQSTLDIWSRDCELDAIEDSIRSPYGWKGEIMKCMSWEEANQRIWRKLQIRGLLDKKESPPMATFHQWSRSPDAFIGVVKQSWERFRGQGLKSQQKREALSSAYSTIARQDLELLREYFLLDFDLFDYNSRPDSVFNARQTWDLFNITA